MSDEKFTFKDYLQLSKEQLEEALKQTPKTLTEYNVKSYCRLTIGPSVDDKQTIPLKPGHKFSVLWEYANFDNPTPKAIKFHNIKNLDSEKVFDLYWSNSQLTKWLCKNTKNK